MPPKVITHYPINMYVYVLFNKLRLYLHGQKIYLFQNSNHQNIISLLLQ